MGDESMQIKLLTIGDSNVGKSWLLLRWAEPPGKFNPKSTTAMPTIGIDFKNKDVQIDGKRVKLQIWDTAGQERFRTITTSYYRNSHGILLVYDITDRNSFTNMRNWISQIQLNADINVNKILIGNKCDLQQLRQVTFEEGESLAREFKMPFMETSAMNDINVERAFMLIATETKIRMETNPPSTTNKLKKDKGGGKGGVTLDQKPKSEKKSSRC
jgi:small GTP-binding protein